MVQLLLLGNITLQAVSFLKRPLVVVEKEVDGEADQVVDELAKEVSSPQWNLGNTAQQLISCETTCLS